MAVLQRFKDINRVMTETFLKNNREGSSFKKPGVAIFDPNKRDLNDYSQKMIAIMKEMQSPKKFNSPIRRRNLF